MLGDMTTHTWNGHTIEVESYSTMKGLWFTVALSVRVDGAAVFLGPDSFELRTVVPFEVADSGVVRKGQVVSRVPAGLLRTAYRILVEGQEVARGAVRARNWYIGYGILAGLSAVLVQLWIIYRSLH
jgi:hypothetical protein